MEEVPAVLIPWIRAVRLQLRERFRTDLPVLRLHFDRGVMEVARTSMIHAAAPHFLWPFAVRYAAHQLNLWPRVSLPETSPTLRWTGEVGDASRFRVWGSRAFVRDTTADKLSSRAIPCVFLGFPPDAPGWQFYHPTSRRVFPSQDVTFDESVPFYRLFPYRTAPPPPPPLFLAPEVTGDSGAAGGGAASGCAEPEHAEPGGAGPGGAEPRDTEPGGAEPGGAEPRGAEPRSDASRGTLLTLELEVLELVTRSLETLQLEVLEQEALELRPLDLEALELEPMELEALALEALELEALDLESLKLEALALEALEALELEALELEVLELEALGSSDQRHKPASRSASPVRTARRAHRVPRPRPPPVPGTHTMALRPSSVPQRVPLPSPPASSLLDVPDPEFDLVRAASPTVTRLLATLVTDPSFESTAASALVAELVDFAAACRLDYAASLVAESKSVLSGVSGLLARALGRRTLSVLRLLYLILWPGCLRLRETRMHWTSRPRALTQRQLISGPYSSQWQTAMDAEMASWKSTGTYVDEVPPPGANIVDGMWIFRVKRPPGSPPVFKACYVARGFSQRQGVDFFQTFSPTPKMTTLWVLLHVAAQRDYELHSLDFSTAFLQGSLHEEIWLRRPPGFTGSFPPGTQWSLRRPVYGLRQAPREWHDTLRTTLAALGFAPSTADPSLFLRIDTSLSPFYILVYVDDLVFASAETEALALVKSEL
ncbi:unnamed protein product [Closterium sp. Yama58-4]|nr:unnamed protein product [Closterium sp. Yama58-4]